MKLSSSNTRGSWLVRNFWLLTMLINLGLLFVFFVILALLLR
jgi:uncharacterized membrane protein